MKCLQSIKMGKKYPLMVLRVAMWLLVIGTEPGECVWDTLSERYDGIGSGDAHSNGKDKRCFHVIMESSQYLQGYRALRVNEAFATFACHMRTISGSKFMTRLRNQPHAVCPGAPSYPIQTVFGSEICSSPSVHWPLHSPTVTV